MPSSIPESGSDSRPSALRRLVRQRGAVVGLVILGALAAMALAAPRSRRSNPPPRKPLQRGALPRTGSLLLLGRDQFGRDLASRVRHVAPLSFTVGPTSVW